MAFFIDRAGNPQHVEIGPEIYAAAAAEHMTVQSHLNKKYAKDFKAERGTPFQQLAASEGLVIPGANSFGVRPGTLEDIIEGKMSAAGPTNSGQQSAPFGQSARSLAPIAILDMVEATLSKDFGEDAPYFDDMVGFEQTLNAENFIQPIINYKGDGGPESARAQRVAQFAEPGNILQIGVSETIRSLPTFGIGVEYSDKARRALTIDVIALTIARYVQVERDQRVYGYINALFNGDNDLIQGAVTSVSSSSLDSASTGGVLTHRAWVKFLARNRRFRRITHVMGDIDAYLKFEARQGRPGSNNYDPTLERIDPQARMENKGFANDVKWFMTDPATEGGPVPAGEIWAIDASKAITRIRNAAADYQASQDFALRRATAMRWDWSEAVMRMVGDADMRSYDRLVITP